ncbi:MAG: LuxR C-terminal-related transcriptional regulator [Thiotrichales bacterium]
MSLPVLATKLYAPPARPGSIPRSRLIGRLDQGSNSKMTLVSASAGFGKSTLLSDWASLCGHPVAWLSLDAADSDLQRFMMYLVAALRAVHPDSVQATALTLESAQPPNPEFVLTMLLNELTKLEDSLILVLDDYHLVDSQAVDGALAFLLEHLPAQLHLVIATREDPQLPLARMRARGQMMELRAADLRFTLEEAGAFLTEAMGLALSEPDIAALEVRTEGWIAGLQMAALSMQGRADNSDFISEFTGSHRFVLDFLAEEVLQRQPAQIRDFLAKTSLLERFSAELCDTVTGQPNSVQILATLERENLFLVPLDDHRRWFRYHHLFAEVLRAHAALESEEKRSLHERASLWFEQQEFFAEAIDHAIAAENTERVVGLIEAAWPEMRKSQPEPVFLKWLESLPPERVDASAILCVYRGFALLPFEIEAADGSLQCAENLLSASRAEKNPLAGADATARELASLPGMIAVARAYQAGATGNFAGIVEFSERALELLPDYASIWRGSAAALLGMAQWFTGDLEAACQSIEGGSKQMRHAGEIGGEVSTIYLLAALKASMGRLKESERECRKALEVGAVGKGAAPVGTADVHVTLAAIYFQRGQLEQAEQQLNLSRALGEHAALSESRHHWYIAMALIRQAQGNFEDAEALLDEARDLQVDSPAPDARPVAAWKARLDLVQGHTEQALSWSQARGLSFLDELNFMQEFEHLTFARVQLQEAKTSGDHKKLEALIEFLERLEIEAEQGGRNGSVIESLLLKALAWHALKNTGQADAALAQALQRAEPEGVVQPFIEVRDTLKPLLTGLPAKNKSQTFVRQILETRSTAPQPSAPAQTLIEPLSDRELEVLKYLASELNGPEIASQLFVSLNTLRTHTKNIYAKLAVNNRRAAVRRAGELGLSSQ